MERIVFGVGALCLLASLCVMLYIRRQLVHYTNQLMKCLDSVLAGKNRITLQESRETLMGKVQMKIYQLYEAVERKAEENLQQRQQLQEIISDVSHQVKTPVASLRMYHSLLERPNLKLEEREDFLRGAQQQADKLEFFMDSMIKMSRMEAGLVKTEPEKASVYELVARAVCDAALKAEEKKIEIQVDMQEELTAWFDRRWTEEAVFNILDNAVKYTEPEGSIWISCRQTDFYVRIEIRDNGSGIEEAHLTDIFKRFYREPRAAGKEGVGIGLYLAREIIMQQKGFIEVRSKVGKGTCFYISLPIQRQNTALCGV